MEPELILPIEAHRGAILEALASGSSLVLSAETGSGKTTHVPRMLLESAAISGRILVLQPRRVATRAATKFVASRLGEKLGDRVGYRTRLDRQESRATRVLYITDGIFMRMVQSDSLLRGIGVVMVDEYHERTLASDLAVGLVRHLQQSSRPDLKLIVASATIDAESMAITLGASVLRCSGRLFPVAVQYDDGAREGEPSWKRAARGAMTAVNSQKSGDVLIFLPGKGEIERCAEVLRADATVTALGIEVLPLHGALSPDQQDRAIEASNQRRIVVATNVAETSLTIPGVTTVIDAGLLRVHRFDPRRGLNTLRLEEHSRASADQRAGRAGRVRPGVCIRLWSERAHARRAAHEQPEVSRVELAECVLQLAALGWRDAAAFPWMTMPPADRLADAKRILRLVDAIDETSTLTDDGRRMSAIPTHPRMARVLLNAAESAMLKRASMWAAIIGERDPAERVDRETLANLLGPDDSLGDLVARERLVEAVQGGRVVQGADRGACHEIDQVAKQLERATREAVDADPWPTDHPPHDQLVRCLIAGFPDRVGWRPDANRPHVAMRDLRACEISADSLVLHKGAVIALETGDRGDGRRALATLSLVEHVSDSVLRSELAHRIQTTHEHRWDAQHQAVMDVEEEHFDGAVMSSVARPSKDGPSAGALIADLIVDGTLHLERWDESIERWLARVRTVAQWFPERNLPTFTSDDLRIVLRDLCADATRWSQVRERLVLPVLEEAISWEDRRFVDVTAPSEITLPSGRQLRITYEPGQPPRARGRIQDFYGLAETPRVAGGREAVLLELTGPNMRPLQVTSDLGNFWKVLYPQIRPELKRRYPKHDWR